MDSIRIDSGEKRIAINDDPERVIVFNPSDVLFAEKFYALMGSLEARLTEYEQVNEELGADSALDDHGLPVNVPERLEALKGTCVYLRGEIDTLFGDGTSQMAFGDTLSLDVFTQFLEGITPFIKTARTASVDKYKARKPKPRRKAKK